MGCKCLELDKLDFLHTHDPRLLTNNKTKPVEGCLYCAEKHIATAACLAREIGYEGVNRGYIIGELVAACWHLHGIKFKEAEELSNKLREFRHKIQSREEDSSCLNFDSYLQDISDLIDLDRK